MSNYDASSDRHMLVEIKKHLERQDVEFRQVAWIMPVAVFAGIIGSVVVAWIARSSQSDFQFVTSAFGIVFLLFVLMITAIKHAKAETK